MPNEDVAIIGAGPYGLSIAANLAKSGLRVRLFGSPMQTWRTRMPAGMHLKSEGCASGLYEPERKFTLSRYCAERGIPYADFGLPVALQNFADYGEEFARRYVPMLEDRNVTGVRRGATGFELALADGKTVTSRLVICATGITDFAYLPAQFAELSPEIFSHCSAHHGLSGFAGKTVAVLGGGASAADYAALLAQAGATTHLVTRRTSLAFHLPPHARGLREKLRYPRTTLGPGWNSMFYTKLPRLFHAMPEARRVAITRRHLGPAPCWFVRDAVESGVSVHAQSQITGVTARAGRARLEISGPVAKTLEVDHILAATGYQTDLTRLKFLDAQLQTDIQTDAAGAPKLSAAFESSVPGLYFAGAVAANAFGPLLRFACGAEFASRRLARHLR